MHSHAKGMLSFLDLKGLTPISAHPPAVRFCVGPLRALHKRHILGLAGFQLCTGGLIKFPLAEAPFPRKGSIDEALKSSHDQPRALEVTQNQIQKKMKMVFLESARRGGSAKSSFALYFWCTWTIFNTPKKFPGARFHHD